MLKLYLLFAVAILVGLVLGTVIDYYCGRQSTLFN